MGFSKRTRLGQRPGSGLMRLDMAAELSPGTGRVPREPRLRQETGADPSPGDYSAGIRWEPQGDPHGGRARPEGAERRQGEGRSTTR
jgi:hypothetical protein